MTPLAVVGMSYSPRAASAVGGDIEQGLAGPEASRPPKTPPPQPSPSPWPAGAAARADGHPTHSHRALESRHGRGEANARDLFQASPSRRRAGRRASRGPPLRGPCPPPQHAPAAVVLAAARRAGRALAAAAVTRAMPSTAQAGSSARRGVQPAAVAHAAPLPACEPCLLPDGSR